MGLLHSFTPNVVDHLRLADDAGDNVAGVDADLDRELKAALKVEAPQAKSTATLVASSAIWVSPRSKRRAMAVGKTLSSSRSFSWFLWSTRAV
jgi:hypothetical protein